MVRFSNILVGLLNFVTLIISIPIVGVLLWSKSHPSIISDAPVKLAYWPLLILGLFIMVQSLLGLFGACCRISLFLWVYLFVTFLLILAVSALLIFGFVVTNKGVGDIISDKGFMHFRLGNYSGWLQNHVLKPDTWSQLTTTLKQANMCGPDSGEFSTAFKVYKRDLSVLKSGCCNPPSSCGYTYVNATYWTIPKSGPTSLEQDCKTWTNDQIKLCFDCDSCKAGMLRYITQAWKMDSLLLGCFLGFLVIVYTIGCCALRNNRDAKYERYR